MKHNRVTDKLKLLKIASKLAIHEKFEGIVGNHFWSTHTGKWRCYNVTRRLYDIVTSHRRLKTL